MALMVLVGSCFGFLFRSAAVAADRVGDECWYELRGNGWSKGTVRRWTEKIGPMLSIPVLLVEDLKTGFVEEVAFSRVCFAQEKPETSRF